MSRLRCGSAVAFCLTLLHGSLPGVAAAAELTAKVPWTRSLRGAVATPYDLFFRAPLVRRHFFREVHRSFGQPAIVRRSQVVVVGTGDGDVLGLSLVDGHLRWRRRGDDAFAGAATRIDLGAGEQAVLLANRRGELQALDPHDGRLRWQTQLDADVRAPARQLGTTLYLCTAANRTYALDATSGRVQWSQGRAPPVGLTVDGHARPALADARLYAAYSDGFLQALDREHGGLLWERPLSLRGGPFIDADADPVVANGRLFACSYSDGVYALDPADGHTLWERPTPAPVSLATYDDLLMVGSAEGWVWAFAQSDGALVWRLRAGEEPISRLQVVGDELLLSAGRAGLVVVDARHGRPRQSSAVGEGVMGDLAVDGGLVVAIGGAGHLYGWQRQ